MKATELAESSFIISLGSLRYANVYRRELGSLQLMKATELAESCFIISLGSLRYANVYRCESGSLQLMKATSVGSKLLYHFIGFSTLCQCLQT
jgi:hypothetical protein